MRSFVNQAKFLRKKRIEAGLTQRDLSKSLGYSSPQMICNWEREMQAITFFMIPKICDLLKIPKEEMISAILADRLLEIEEGFLEIST